MAGKPVSGKKSTGDTTQVTFLAKMKEAKSGDPIAQLTLAGFYEDGYGVARDMGLAAH